jgi:hypothetical protein
MLFNINDFINQDMLLINKKILQNHYNLSEKRSEEIMASLNKK